MQPRFAATAVLILALLPSFGVAWAQAPDSDRVERGRALLAQYQCGACHTIPGVVSSRGQVSQPLKAWSRRSYIAGRLPNRPDVLAQWIAAPQVLVPGTAMPSMGVAPADAQAMAAYLFSLQ
jgi:mono/diheme cytochrome c family protein